VLGLTEGIIFTVRPKQSFKASAAGAVPEWKMILPHLGLNGFSKEISDVTIKASRPAGFTICS
jgi:hypothetical protein